MGVALETSALSFVAPSNCGTRLGIFSNTGPSGGRQRLLGPLPCQPEGGVEGTTEVQSQDAIVDTDSLLLDLPSPLLLSGSMGLAIVGTGTFFTALTDPSTNVLLTAAVVILTAPTSLFLFVAAIKKGQAETDEDDKRLNEGR